MAQSTIHAVMGAAFGFLLGITLLSVLSKAMAQSASVTQRLFYGAIVVAIAAVTWWPSGPSLAVVLAIASLSSCIALAGQWIDRDKKAPTCACFGDLSPRLRPLLPLTRRMIHGITAMLWTATMSLLWMAHDVHGAYDPGPGLLLFTAAIIILLHPMLAPAPATAAPAFDRFPRAAVDWPSLALSPHGGRNNLLLANMLPAGAQCLIVFGSHGCGACNVLVNRLSYLLPQLSGHNAVVLAGIASAEDTLATISDASEIEKLKQTLGVQAFPTAFLVTASASGYSAERITADILGRAVDMIKTGALENICD